MSEHLQFDPAAMDPRAVYRLLVGSVVPRPIGWVSTVSAAPTSRRFRSSPWSASPRL